MARALTFALTLLLATGALARTPSSESMNRLADDFAAAWGQRLERPDLSDQGNKKWLAQLNGFEARLARIHHKKVDEQGRLTEELLRLSIKTQKRHIEGNHHLDHVNAVDSPLLTTHFAASFDAQTVADWRWMIRQLRYSDKLFTDYTALLQRGLASGRIQSKNAISSSIDLLKVLCSSSKTANPLYALNAELAEQARSRPALRKLKRELAAATESSVRAHRKMKRFLERQYLPKTHRLGSPKRPKNPERYLHFVGMHLGDRHQSLDRIEAFGHKEIKRLHGELAKVMKQVNPKAKNIRSFMSGLYRRKGTFFKNGQEKLAAARREHKRATREARSFVRIPRNQLSVESVGPAEDGFQTAQYANTGTRSGVVELNTGELIDTINRFELANLMRHEGVPGHHLQAIYAQLNPERNALRHDPQLLVYDEGWAMYVENWFYGLKTTTPTEKVGHLINQLWAASMLVIDVGLHSGKMTRVQAETLMAKAMFTSRAAIREEVERVINWPGQGLTYYIGKREFLKTERLVKRVLGKHFDGKRFRERMLRYGPLPHRTVRRQMARWAKRRLGQVKRPRRARARR